MGSDSKYNSAPGGYTDFNPRSRMGSDRLLTIVKIFIGISIHAPRMGSDSETGRKRKIKRYFNPRPPHGERLKSSNPASSQAIFQSTPPAWGATQYSQRSRPSDTFQSTPPAWGATDLASDRICECFISIHAPRMGSD